MENMLEFLRGRRTYRRFLQRPITPEITVEMIEAARIAGCAANRQALKYVVVQSPAIVTEMNRLVHWAAYLPPEQGTPAADETPVLFVVVLQDEAVPGAKASDTDAGLALGSMTAAAWAHGVGSCIMGAIDRPAIMTLLDLPETMRIHTAVAFGYPCHKSTVVEMKDGNVKYYLDENRDYCVPKRGTDEILLKTV